MIGEKSGLDTLSNCHLFRSLDATGRAALFEVATALEVPAGKLIVREGDPGDALFVIKRGRVRVTTNKDDESVTLALLGGGACFGEVAVLTHQPRTATVIADEDCSLLAFSRKELEQQFAKHPEVKQLLEMMVMGRAQDTIQKMYGVC